MPPEPDNMKTIQFIGAATICLFVEGINHVSIVMSGDALTWSMSRDARWTYQVKMKIEKIEQNALVDFQTMAYDFARMSAAQLASAEKEAKSAALH